jgi:peptidyl-prolyl cis-trans isomerase C
MKPQIWGIWGLIGGTALALLANTGPAAAQQAVKPAAVVNGTPIAMSELEALLKQAPPTPTPLTEQQKRQRQMEALSMLIDDLLMQQFLMKNTPRVDPSEIRKEMIDLVDSLKKSGKTLESFLAETGDTEAQLQGKIATMLQWNAYVRNHVTEADIRRYWQENKDFFDRVEVRASHIELRVSAAAGEADRQAGQAKLKALRQEIVAGKIDFADAARKYSEASTAAAGGDLGYFPPKFMVEEPFGKAAFSLKVGDISDVVQTEYAMHLIKVTDRKPGQASDYNKIKESVREFYVEELRQTLLAQQRKLAHVEVYVP